MKLEYSFFGSMEQLGCFYRAIRFDIFPLRGFTTYPPTHWFEGPFFLRLGQIS
jgi:hypothetical protein